MLDLALLLLRLVAGLTFAAHGAQKAFGWWGGPGPAGWHGAIERMGFRPTNLFVAASIGAELVGGLFLALGLFTPVAAAVLVAQSIVIIGQVHWAKGFFSTQGGFEFPLVLGVVVTAICLIGSGAMSLDAALGLPFPDPVRAALLPLAIAGGLASHLLPQEREPAAPIQLPSSTPARGAVAAEQARKRAPSRPFRRT